MRYHVPVARSARWLLPGSLAALALCLGGAVPPLRAPVPATPAPSTEVPSPASPPGATPPANSADLLPAEIATLGWDALTDSPVVLLREIGSDKVVPIWVGTAEARSIALALQHIELPRPQTHDLMRNLISDLGAKLLGVRVHELRGDTYYGLLELEVRCASEPLLVDSRPSDALALAVRTGAPIRVSKQILDQTPALDFRPLEASEQVVRAAGLTVMAVSDEVRRQRGLPDRAGLLVIDVSADVAARGLRAGDLIVELNGQPAAAPIALLDAVRRSAPELPLRVTYWRDGEEHRVELPLADAGSLVKRA